MYSETERESKNTFKKYVVKNPFIYTLLIKRKPKFRLS